MQKKVFWQRVSRMRADDPASVLREQLIKLLIKMCGRARERVKDTGRFGTGAVRAFLTEHAADLKALLAGDALDADEMLDKAALAGNLGVLLVLLDAGARPLVGKTYYNDLYTHLLDNARIYDLNGDEMDDADVARGLRVVYDVHGVRLKPSEYASDPTGLCVMHDRLECLKVMFDIDPHARGPVDRYGRHKNLLHLAGLACKPRMVRFLLESGWSLDDFSLIGRVMFDVPPSSSDDDTNALIDTLAALLHDVADVAPVVRSSGLCDSDRESMHGNTYHQPSPDCICIHVYVCAAVGALCALPHSWRLSTPFDQIEQHSLSLLQSLPLDEHVSTVGGLYLPDSLRAAGVVTRPMKRDGTTVIEYVPAAIRFALRVDTLRYTDDEQKQWRWLAASSLKRAASTSITGSSITLRCWAWMRRLHALHQRRRELQRMGAWRGPEVFRRPRGRHSGKGHK